MSQRDLSQIRDLVDLQERMNRLLDYTNERSRVGREDDLSQASDWVPLADIFETEAALVIKLGTEIDRREIDVKVTENRLMISGQRQMDNEASARTTIGSNGVTVDFEVLRTSGVCRSGADRGSI
jgi:HSP20 family molecular chaperone IbpA